ncbi:hypothetical protein BaRGS_00017073, partial [Batillaria attramentaria]
ASHLKTKHSETSRNWKTDCPQQTPVVSLFISSLDEGGATVISAQCGAVMEAGTTLTFLISAAIQAFCGGINEKVDSRGPLGKRLTFCWTAELLGFFFCVSTGDLWELM